jgi:hypothetical protein
MKAHERLGLAFELHKASSALLNPAMRIARGPGRMVQKLIGQRPLIAAGLDNISARGYARQLGDLPESIQRTMFTRQVPLPGMQQTRQSMAQYVRSARGKYQHFSGNPQFYPDSQFHEVPLPHGGTIPLRFDGYYSPTTPAVTGFKSAPSAVPGQPFVRGSSGAATNFNWRGAELPSYNLPSHSEWQSIRAKTPKVLM